MIYLILVNIAVVLINLVLLQQTGLATISFWLGFSVCNLIYLATLYCIKENNNE